MLMLSLDPTQLAIPDLHQYLIGAVAPRPIAFVSSVSPQGIANLAPYSFFNVFGSNPPLAIFSSNRRVRDNSTKDTFLNVEATQEVVINVVSYAMVQQMSLASVEYPSEVSEFDKSGFTALKSDLVSPFRVQESPVQFECKVDRIIPTGEEGGAANLILCRILRIHVDEQVLDENGRIDPHKIDLVGRMGRAYYCRASGNAVWPLLRPVKVIGIGFDQLPGYIRESSVLRGNDLAQLAAFESIPIFKEEILADELLINIRAGNQQDQSRQVHQYAQDLIGKGELEKAWQILLSEIQ